MLTDLLGCWVVELFEVGVFEYLVDGESFIGIEHEHFV